jgi:alanine racemase
MTFRSQIISIQSLNKNERIGYGGRVKTNKPSKIAIVYCGYADGFPQIAIDGTSVMVNSHKSKIIGRVSMDLISIDVTKSPIVKLETGANYGLLNCLSWKIRKRMVCFLMNL